MTYPGARGVTRLGVGAGMRGQSAEVDDTLLPHLHTVPCIAACDHPQRSCLRMNPSSTSRGLIKSHHSDRDRASGGLGPTADAFHVGANSSLSEARTPTLACMIDASLMVRLNIEVSATRTRKLVHNSSGRSRQAHTIRPTPRRR